jgi:hypothetical protein
MIRKLLAAAAVLVGATSFAPDAHATNYTLWIHGFTGLSGYQTPSGWQYWHGGAVQPGINAVPVNYNGTLHISQSNPTVVAALNQYCTGSNWCYVAAHSMGAAQIGYALANAPAGTWNIYWVGTGGGAAGGSELANAGNWLLGSNTAASVLGGAVNDLTTSNMRALYNHDTLGDNVSGYVYPSLGGNWSSFDTCFFPGGGWLCPGVGSGGGNDRAVAYHSAGFFRSVGNDGTASATGAKGGTYWDYTWTWYVDNESSGSYTHFTGDSNGGVMAWVSSMMASYAQ